MSFDVMLITDESLGDRLVDVTASALEHVPAGRVALQLRSKRQSDRAFLHLARELRELTLRRGVELLVNGRPDIACLVNADGVHLPASGLSVSEARAYLGDESQIGVSCHTQAELQHANGANYVLLSPYAHSPGKSEPLGSHGFASFTRHLSMRVLALGGIDATNAAAAIQAGANGVAVIRAVYQAPSPSEALAQLLHILDTTPRTAR